LHGTFTPTTVFEIIANMSKDNTKRLVFSAELKESGDTKIAFKIEDDQGGETLLIRDLEVV
jgi:hypothetical protein